jgi:large subunit ribosomal protein L18
MEKRLARKRRALRVRAKIRELGAHRLCIHRTPRHIYAQIIAPSADRVIACASTNEKEVREALKVTGNISAAVRIGQLIAERAKAQGVETVAFDRSGFKFHGRVKALADAARESGLQF